MTDPLFFLALSLLLVAVALTSVLIALIPAVQEIARVARSIERLADTLSRDLPPTLEAIRLTGLEISDLTDDVSQGVQRAGRLVQKVDQSLEGTRRQVQEAQISSRSLWVGVQAAWQTWRRPRPSRSSRLRLPPPEEANPSLPSRRASEADPEDRRR